MGNRKMLNCLGCGKETEAGVEAKSVVCSDCVINRISALNSTPFLKEEAKLVEQKKEVIQPQVKRESRKALVIKKVAEGKDKETIIKEVSEIYPEISEARIRDYIPWLIDEILKSKPVELSVRKEEVVDGEKSSSNI